MYPTPTQDALYMKTVRNMEGKNVGIIRGKTSKQDLCYLINTKDSNYNTS